MVTSPVANGTLISFYSGELDLIAEVSATLSEADAMHKEEFHSRVLDEVEMLKLRNDPRHKKLEDVSVTEASYIMNISSCIINDVETEPLGNDHPNSSNDTHTTHQQSWMIVQRLVWNSTHKFPTVLKQPTVMLT